MKTQTATSTTLDAALEQLFDTDMFYADGLVNHGPMAAEALERMGLIATLDRFLDDYVPRLEPVKDRGPKLEPPDDDWPEFVRTHATALASNAGALAGHGLLRVAHAVRALERDDTPTRRADLAVAVDYWAAGDALNTPAPSGHLSLAQAVAALPRLADEQSPGLISDTMERVVLDPRVRAVLAARAPHPDAQQRLDDLALAAVDRYLANGDQHAFTFIHGVTVPTMASTLLPYLGEAAQRVLVDAVEGFVMLAIVGYDRKPQPAAPTPADASPTELAIAAAETCDDHTIKFTDACIVLAERTNAETPLLAAAIRCTATARPS